MWIKPIGAPHDGIAKIQRFQDFIPGACPLGASKQHAALANKFCPKVFIYIYTNTRYVGKVKCI